MTDQLVQFSDALAARVEFTKPTAVALRLAHERYVSGIAWRPDAIVASEQSLPRRDEFEVVIAGGAVTNAKVAGRDPPPISRCCAFKSRLHRFRSPRARRVPVPS